MCPAKKHLHFLLLAVGIALYDDFPIRTLTTAAQMILIPSEHSTVDFEDAHFTTCAQNERSHLSHF